jgi:hypothetical protein
LGAGGIVPKIRKLYLRFKFAKFYFFAGKVKDAPKVVESGPVRTSNDLQGLA